MNGIVLVVSLALLAWAFAEAFSWPVVPDAALATAVILMPAEAMVFAAATVAGSVLGGALAVVAYRRGHRWPLPLVSPRMRSHVRRWMDRGVIGLWHQPLSAVPYKAFVVESADRGIGLAPFVGATLLFRGARMLVAAGLAFSASHLVASWMPGDGVVAARLVLLSVGGAVFLVGWRLAWQSWSRPAGNPTQRSVGGRRAPGHTMTP